MREEWDEARLTSVLDSVPPALATVLRQEAPLALHVAAKVLDYFPDIQVEELLPSIAALQASNPRAYLECVESIFQSRLHVQDPLTFAELLNVVPFLATISAQHLDEAADQRVRIAGLVNTVGKLLLKERSVHLAGSLTDAAVQCLQSADTTVASSVLDFLSLLIQEYKRKCDTEHKLSPTDTRNLQQVYTALRVLL